MRASRGARIETPSGMVLDGSLDKVDAPVTMDPAADPDGDGVVNEIPEAIVDYLEFYLLNYFKPALGEQTDTTRHGRQLMDSVGCNNLSRGEPANQSRPPRSRRRYGFRPGKWNHEPPLRHRQASRHLV